MILQFKYISPRKFLNNEVWQFKKNGVAFTRSKGHAEADVALTKKTYIHICKLNPPMNKAICLSKN